jgi:hypothetical protein
MREYVIGIKTTYCQDYIVLAKNKAEAVNTLENKLLFDESENVVAYGEQYGEEAKIIGGMTKKTFDRDMGW